MRVIQAVHWSTWQDLWIRYAESLGDSAGAMLSGVARRVNSIFYQGRPVPNRRFQFQKSGQLFIRTHNETLYLVAMLLVT
jgi:hypothetical protein